MPTDHPVLLPQLQLHIQYGIHDGASGAALSLASGSIYSIHADFFNAWDEVRLASLITTCIDRAQLSPVSAPGGSFAQI